MDKSEGALMSIEGAAGFPDKSLARCRACKVDAKEEEECTRGPDTEAVIAVTGFHLSN